MNAADGGLESLRAAYTSLAERAVPTGDCPEPERLWSAFRGESAAEESRAIVDHTVVCAACAEAWRLARDLSAPAAVAEPALERERPWWGGWVALAAAVAVVALSVGVLLRGGGPVSPQYRSGEAVTIRSLIPEDRPLPRARCILRWTKGPEGTRYDVQVATEDLTTVARSRGLEVPEYQVPETALSSLPAGAKLLWQVEAVSPDGARAASITFLARLE